MKRPINLQARSSSPATVIGHGRNVVEARAIMAWGGGDRLKRKAERAYVTKKKKTEQLENNVVAQY